MSQVGNGRVPESKDGAECKGEKHDEKDMSKQSNWAAVPDLLLILVPTAILLKVGNEVGKS